MLHFDSVSTNPTSQPEDTSGNNVQCNVIIRNNRFGAGRTSTLSKFGGKCWNMNASPYSRDNNHMQLSCTDNNLIFGTGDFTIDFWIYKTRAYNNAYADETILAMGINNEVTPSGQRDLGMPFKIYLESGGHNSGQSFRLLATLFSGTGSNHLWEGPNFRPYLNQWVHVAFVRHNGVATLYMNGVAYTSRANTANMYTNKLFIGGENENAWYKFYQGYIDEVHLRNKAAYTEAFTPPTHAFGKEPQNIVQASAYYGSKSELAYMLPLTQTSSFLAVAKKTNSDSTTYAEVLNIKHDGKILDTWGDYGKIALTAPGYSYSNPETMWMDRELNLYVGGCAQKVSNGLKDGIVWKITPDGALDTAFGTNGVDIKDNTTLDESITSMYNDYANNKMIYTSLFTGDSSGNFNNHPMMIFDQYNFGGNLTFLNSYDYITKQTTPSEGLNRVLQDMGLVNAAHIKMPASMFNNLLGTYNETSNSFPVTDITLTVDQDANDNITVVSGGLIKDFWNYFVAKIETRIPSDKRDLWDDSPTGANSYTNAKLQTFFRDVGLGTLTVPNVNDVIREYEANASALFPYRSGVHRRQGFVAGDKAGINAGVQITFQTTISAATGGTASDTIIRETRTFNLSLIHISEPTRPERIGDGGVWV